jgi:hypothetical protein
LNELGEMSPIGTLRHFAATRYFRRFRIEADIDQSARMAGSVENDRAAKLAAIPAGESPANRGVQSLL